MKHFVTVTAKNVSKHFLIKLNDLDLYIFEDSSCETLDAFAESLGVKNPELLRTSIEYSINEDESHKKTFSAINGDVADFSYELFEAEDSYTVVEDGFWYVHFYENQTCVWTEEFETLEEVKTSFSAHLELGLFEI